MKKLLLFAIAAVFSYTVAAKEANPPQKTDNRKIEAKKVDSLAHQTAQMCIEQHNWVLEVNEISYTGSIAVSVPTNVNYLSVNGVDVVLQTSSDDGDNSYNGLGGVTVNGTINSDKQHFEKDGTLVYEFHVLGVSLQATVTVSLEPNNNYASAYVDFDTGPDSMTLYGNIYRGTTSNEVEGESQY